MKESLLTAGMLSSIKKDTVDWIKSTQGEFTIAEKRAYISGMNEKIKVRKAFEKTQEQRRTIHANIRHTRNHQESLTDDEDDVQSGLTPEKQKKKRLRQLYYEKMGYMTTDGELTDTGIEHKQEKLKEKGYMDDNNTLTESGVKFFKKKTKKIARRPDDIQKFALIKQLLSSTATVATGVVSIAGTQLYNLWSNSTSPSQLLNSWTTKKPVSRQNPKETASSAKLGFTPLDPNAAPVNDAVFVNSVVDDDNDGDLNSDHDDGGEPDDDDDVGWTPGDDDGGEPDDDVDSDYSDEEEISQEELDDLFNDPENKETIESVVENLLKEKGTKVATGLTTLLVQGTKTKEASQDNLYFMSQMKPSKQMSNGEKTVKATNYTRLSTLHEYEDMTTDKLISLMTPEFREAYMKAYKDL